MFMRSFILVVCSEMCSTTVLPCHADREGIPSTLRRRTWHGFSIQSDAHLLLDWFIGAADVGSKAFFGPACFCSRSTDDLRQNVYIGDLKRSVGTTIDVAINEYAFSEKVFHLT
jgi:hypothetical protein